MNIEITATIETTTTRRDIFNRLTAGDVFFAELYETAGGWQIEAYGKAQGVVSELQAAGFTVLQAEDGRLDGFRYATVEFK